LVHLGALALQHPIDSSFPVGVKSLHESKALA
jgi:hypothetical protein